MPHKILAEGDGKNRPHYCEPEKNYFGTKYGTVKQCEICDQVWSYDKVYKDVTMWQPRSNRWARKRGLL